MYNRYSVKNFKTSKEVFEKIVEEILSERFSNKLEIEHIHRDNRSYSIIVNNDAKVPFYLQQIFSFTVLSFNGRLDFPEQTNYFFEYLRDVFMHALAAKLNAKILNHNSRSEIDPDPNMPNNFLLYMKRRFGTTSKELKHAKKYYLEFVKNTRDLKSLYDYIEGDGSISFL